MCTHPTSDSQIHREGLAIVRQLDAARARLGNLVLHQDNWKGQILDIKEQLSSIIVDVAAICTDDGSNAEVRVFLATAEVFLPEEYLTEL